MTKLVLDAQQSNLVAASDELILIVDASGNCVGELHRPLPKGVAPLSMTLEEIEEIERRMADPNPKTLTTAELLKELQSEVRS